jgi:predicted dehydrogenase
MRKLKTAIIGMGKMGKIRYDAALRHGGFDVIAICDLDEKILAPYTCDRYLDAFECMEKARPEVVIICTVNKYISTLVCRALYLGIHVFSEKPPGRNLGETMLMGEHLDKSDGVLKFGFNHRYHHSVIEAKTLIDFGLLGEVLCARGIYGKMGSVDFAQEWRSDLSLSGGGILLDQGIHMIDLLCYFLGDFTEVKSAAGQLYWDNTPTEDSVFAILKTDDNRLASLHSSSIHWKHKFDLDIICTEGYVSLNGLLTATQSYGEERISYYQKDIYQSSGKLGNPIEHTMVFDHDDSWAYEMHEFYDAVVRGEPLRNGTIEDAVRVMRLIELIYGRY